AFRPSEKMKALMTSMGLDTPTPPSNHAFDSAYGVGPFDPYNWCYSDQQDPNVSATSDPPQFMYSNPRPNVQNTLSPGNSQYDVPPSVSWEPPSPNTITSSSQPRDAPSIPSLDLCARPTSKESYNTGTTDDEELAAVLQIEELGFSDSTNVDRRVVSRYFDTLVGLAKKVVP
ncbi:hypothetical protein FRB99_007780, partial [Tulasnella sp. 403]